jgi:prophage regulatory protein
MGPQSAALRISVSRILYNLSPNSFSSLRSEVELAARLRVLRLTEVQNATGLCRSMIYKLETEERFPKRIKLGIRAVGCLENGIQTWIAERLRFVRSAPTPPASEIHYEDAVGSPGRVETPARRVRTAGTRCIWPADLRERYLDTKLDTRVF